MMPSGLYICFHLLNLHRYIVTNHPQSATNPEHAKDKSTIMPLPPQLPAAAVQHFRNVAILLVLALCCSFFAFTTKYDCTTSTNGSIICLSKGLSLRDPTWYPIFGVFGMKVFLTVAFAEVVRGVNAALAGPVAVGQANVAEG